MKAKSLTRRWILFLLGLIISGFGVAFSTRAGLGTSPISSVPFVLSFICPFSFGMLTFAVNLLFVSGQILIRKREFELFQLLQIPMLFIFGVCIDLGMFISEPFLLHDFLLNAAPASEWSFAVYASRHAELLFGCLVLASGIVLQLEANTLLLPGDALVKDFCGKYGFEFSKIKMSLESLLVISSLILCLTSLHELRGIREGTFLAILYVGTTIRLIRGRIRKRTLADCPARLSKRKKK